MHRSRKAALSCFLFLAFCVPPPAPAANGFVNFETPQVHPVDLSPDRNTLAVVNTADHRLLLFDVASGKPKLVGMIPVGLVPGCYSTSRNRTASTVPPGRRANSLAWTL